MKEGLPVPARSIMPFPGFGENGLKQGGLWDRKARSPSIDGVEQAEAQDIFLGTGDQRAGSCNVDL